VSTSSHDSIGYGIIGCGVIAPWHAESIRNHVTGARLIACCDEIPERAAEFAAKYEIPHHYTSVDDLLARDDIQCVSACVPSGMHGDMVIKASNAGKHAMTEKPIDIRLARIDEMIRVCEANGTKLGVIFQRRTSLLWQQVRQVVQDGMLGRMVLGDAYLKYYRSPEYYLSGEWRGTWALDGGGALMNQGVHLVDILQWVMGGIDQLFAYADHLARDIEVEDTTVSALRFKNGAFGNLTGTTSVIGSAEWEKDAAGNVDVTKWGGLNHRMEFHGDRGTIMVEGEKVVRWVVPGMEMPDFGGGEGREGMATDPRAIGLRGHAIQLQDLVDAIREDRAPMVTGRDARDAVEIILGVYRSARTGQPVTFPLAEE